MMHFLQAMSRGIVNEIPARMAEAGSNELLLFCYAAKLNRAGVGESEWNSVYAVQG